MIFETHAHYDDEAFEADREEPPNRVCYKIRHRYPKVSNKLAVEYFEHELERFLEKRHLHIPVGVVWHS